MQQCTSLFKAIRIISLADVIMSTDNILAIAGASEGSSFLVLFGLGLSIPIVVLGATFIAILMKHCSWIIYVGAGILGEVAAKMILEDNFIQATIGEVPTRFGMGNSNWPGGPCGGDWVLVCAPIREMPHSSSCLIKRAQRQVAGDPSRRAESRISECIAGFRGCNVNPIACGAA